MAIANDEKVVTQVISSFHVKEGDELLKGQLHFWTKDNWKGAVPADQNQLRMAFDGVCAVLRARLLSRSPEKFETEFRRLLTMAQATFSGEYVQLSEGKVSLEAYKTELIRQEGPLIKDAYLKELLRAVSVASVLIFVVSIVIRGAVYLGEKFGLVAVEKFNVGAASVAAESVRLDPHFSPLHFGFLLVATMWGVWLSFVVRNIDFTFEQLQHPESDLMRPWSRLLMSGLLALILALFFQLKVITITVGNVSTSNISENFLIAIFVGLCLGFTDKALSGEVRRRVEEFLQRANKEH